MGILELATTNSNPVMIKRYSKEDNYVIILKILKAGCSGGSCPKREGLLGIIIPIGFIWVINAILVRIIFC